MESELTEVGAKAMKISVCMATYNGDAYVAEQLGSILTQIGPNDEVIISDDCSNDQTLGVIEQIADPRVTVLANLTNVGYTRNFERALLRASGDYIFIADQDDVWDADKVAMILEELADRDLVIHDVRVADGQLELIHPSHFDAYGVQSGFISNFLRTRYIGSAMAMNRSVLERALPFPGRADLCAYDYWLALVGEAFFKVKLVREPLMSYRRHGGTASTGGAKSDRSVFRRVVVRFYCLWHLLARAAWGASSS